MITRKLGLAFLAIAGSFTWTICDSAEQPSEEVQTVVQPEQKKAALPVGRRDVESEAKWRLIQLLTLETVQKDLGLSAEQINKIKENFKIGKEVSKRFYAKLREILPTGQRFSSEEAEARKRRFQPVWDDMDRKAKELLNEDSSDANAWPDRPTQANPTPDDNPRCLDTTRDHCEAGYFGGTKQENPRRYAMA